MKIYVLYVFISSFIAGQELDILENAYVTTVGGSALFLCSSITDWLDDVVWQANDSNLTENENVTIRMVFGRGRLELHNIPLADNLTVISCHGSVRGNEVVGTSRVLLLQGRLAAVGNLELEHDDDFVSLKWTPPFSFNISDRSTSITYCCFVVSISYLGEEVQLSSECGIRNNSFVYNVTVVEGCRHLKFIVTPENPVGNGTSAIEIYSQSQEWLNSTEIGKVVSENDVSLLMPATVCNAELTLVDLNGENVIVLNNSDLTLDGSNITFSRSHLRNNIRYVVINATNNAGTIVQKLILDENVLQVHINVTGESDKEGWVLPTVIVGVLIIIIPLIFLAASVLILSVCKSAKLKPKLQLAAMRRLQRKLEVITLDFIAAETGPIPECGPECADGSKVFSDLDGLKSDSNVKTSGTSTTLTEPPLSRRGVTGSTVTSQPPMRKNYRTMGASDEEVGEPDNQTKQFEGQASADQDQMSIDIEGQQ